ncbi:hypothetical protein [Pseudomonas oryzihabitans]|uniref:Uncharacterized protein n=1 Tax=Pseudomonas oryzihabitans TaxID=47885 RepID=A0A178LMA1_9PSED|nr:hypothetical protein [Pseudomonas oryzihabitans]OAN31805.1 hypothetical protein A4V15_12155 [Pseudomonas oryzihabitans]
MRYQLTQSPVVDALLFPYRAPEAYRTRADYEQLDRLQREALQDRQREFAQRLHGVMQDGPCSLRSFPSHAADTAWQDLPRFLHAAQFIPFERSTPAAGQDYFAAPPASLADYEGFDVGEDLPVSDEAPAAPPKAERRATPSPVSSDVIDWSGAKEGVVKRHGRYRYRFEKNSSFSYLVHLDTGGLVWGIELQQVVNELNIEVGDRVQLKRMGKETVEVDERILDADGNPTGTRKKHVTRTIWRGRILQKHA